jgi:hypothetical protein
VRAVLVSKLAPEDAGFARLWPTGADAPPPAFGCPPPSARELLDSYNRILSGDESINWTILCVSCVGKTLATKQPLWLQPVGRQPAGRWLGSAGLA